MADSNFIDAAAQIERINKAWEEHRQVVSENIPVLKKLYSTVNVPSQYAESIKSVKISQDALAESTRKVTQRTREEIVETRILNQQKDVLIKSNSELAGAYANLSAKAQMASKNLRDLIVAGKQADQTQRQFNAQLRNAQREFDGYNKKLLQADKAVGAWGRTSQRTITFASGLIGAFGIAGGVTLFAQVVKDFYSMTKELQSLDLALKQVIGTQEDFSRAQEFLSSIAEKYGVGINELTKSYTQFYVSAKDKLSQNQIEGIFESISKAAGAMGLSVDQQQGAFLALTQMLSKGTIQAEELRGQLSERLPGAFGILAKSMGVTEEQLNKLLKEGKVIAAEVLPAFARELEKAYGIENLKRVESLAAAQTRLSNQYTEFIRAVSEGDSVFSKFVQNAIAGTTSILQVVTNLVAGTAKLRQEYLNSQKEIGKSNAQEVIESIKDSDEKRQYAEQAIIRTRKEIAKNRAEFDRLSIESAGMKDKIKGWDGIYKENQALKENKERRNELNNTMSKQVGFVEQLNKYLIEQTEAQKKDAEETEKERKAREKAEEEAAKNRAARLQKEIELQIDYHRNFQENQDNFAQERLVALEEQRKAEIALEGLKYAEEVRLAKGSNDLKRIALIEYQKRDLQLRQKYEDDKEKIEQSALKPKGVAGGQTPKEMTDEVTKSAEKARDAFLDQAKAEEEAKERLKDLRNEAEDYLKAFSSGVFADAGLSSLEKFLDGTIDKLLAGATKVDEVTGEIVEDSRKKFGIYFTAITEVAQEAFNFLAQRSQAGFDIEYNNLEKRKEIALRFGGETAEAREAIEEEYQKRRTELERKQAKQQRQLALFNIAINTAQGITAALTSLPPNPPLAIAIGVIGAIQAGIVASTPLPAFEKGTMNANEGWAIVDEKRPEVHTDKSGNVKSMGSKKGANLRYLSAGDKIYKSHEFFLNKMLSENGIDTINDRMFASNIPNSVNFEGMTAVEMEAIMNKYFSDVQENHTHIDGNGLYNYTKKRGQKTINRNNRINSKGTKV